MTSDKGEQFNRCALITVMRMSAYREAVPGHHFQIALNMAQIDIGPRFSIPDS